MSERVADLYHQQQISAGVLGGLVVVSMVLVSQARSKYEVHVLWYPRDTYFDGLMLLMGLTSLVLVATSWSLGYVAPGFTSESGPRGRRFRRVVLSMNRVGLAMVLLVVALLIVPFSLVAGVSTLLVGAVMFIVVDELRLAALREAHKELREAQAAEQQAPTD